MTGDRIFNKTRLGKLAVLVAFAFFLFILTPSLYVSADIGTDGSETGTDAAVTVSGEETDPNQTDPSEPGPTESLPPNGEGETDPLPTEETQPSEPTGETVGETDPLPPEETLPSEPTGETDPLMTEETQPSETDGETDPSSTEETQPSEPTGETDPLPTEETQPEAPGGDLDPQLFMASFLALEAAVNYGDPSSSLLGFNGGATGGGGWTSGNLGKTYAEGEWVPYQLVLTGVQTAWGAGLDGMSQYDDQIMISYDFTNGGDRFIDMVRGVQVGEDPRNDLEAYPASNGSARNISTRDLLEDAQNDPASKMNGLASRCSGMSPALITKPRSTTPCQGSMMTRQTIPQPTARSLSPNRT